MAKPDKTKTETQAAAPADTTALETRGETQLAAFEYGEDEGSGYENQTNADILIPVLTFLQTNSPQCVEGKPQYMSEAKAGMILNPATGKLYDASKGPGVLIVPITTRQVYTEFVPRDKGGGFVDNHDPDKDMVKAALASGTFGEYKTPNGNDLVDTRIVYALIVEEDPYATPMFCTLALSSTKIKPYRNWNTVLRSFELPIKDASGKLVKRVRPPMFAHLTRLKTVFQQNKDGSWYNPAFLPARGEVKDSLLTTDDPRFVAAKAFKDSIDAGLVKVDTTTMERGSGGGEGTAEKADAAF